MNPCGKVPPHDRWPYCWKPCKFTMDHDGPCGHEMTWVGLLRDFLDRRRGR